MLSTPGPDPSVTTWRIALAPRPRHSTNGRHWWREYVVDAWRSATQAWELACEAEAIGYPTETAEYAEKHPRPRLKDFLIHLSRGQVAPEQIDERTVEAA